MRFLSASVSVSEAISVPFVEYVAIIESFAVKRSKVKASSNSLPSELLLQKCISQSLDMLYAVMIPKAHRYLLLRKYCL